MEMTLERKEAGGWRDGECEEFMNDDLLVFFSRLCWILALCISLRIGELGRLRHASKLPTF